MIFTKDVEMIRFKHETLNLDSSILETFMYKIIKRKLNAPINLALFKCFNVLVVTVLDHSFSAGYI